MQVFAPTPPYSEKYIISFNNDVDETVIVMGDCNAQIGKRTNPMEMATGKFGLL